MSPRTPSMPPELRGITDLREIDVIPPGIYFLCRDGELVYIGQSIYPPARVGQHMKNKEFDRVFFKPVPQSELAETEAQLITHFQPELNRHIRGGRTRRFVTRAGSVAEAVEAGADKLRNGGF